MKKVFRDDRKERLWSAREPAEEGKLAMVVVLKLTRFPSIGEVLDNDHVALQQILKTKVDQKRLKKSDAERKEEEVNKSTPTA